jgi:MmyB-like transcription regulator ligand binding domain
MHEFLRSRRARITPDQAGLPTFGGSRRVPGLRRRDPYDRDLSDLVGELSTQSEIFRTLWAAHNVHAHDSGAKRLHHPLVGELALTYETMELAANPV